MLFVATSMYFPKMQTILDFEVFKGLKRYDEKNGQFWQNREFLHFLLYNRNKADLTAAFFI